MGTVFGFRPVFAVVESHMHRRRRARLRRQRVQMSSRNMEMEVLEAREMLTVASDDFNPLGTGDQPLAVNLAAIDGGARDDLVALGANGDLTIALNGDDDTWQSVQTNNLGLGTVYGLEVAPITSDAFSDIVTQSGDGVHLLTGDGQGGFTTNTYNGDVSGMFATVSGRRVQPAVSLLNDDLAADVVTVAPGTDEVFVFYSDETSTLSNPARFASGANEPLVTVIGDFVADPLPDVAIGHADGTVTFLAGQPGGTLQPRHDLAVTGLGTITGIESADVDEDGDTDLIVSGTDQVTLLLRDPGELTTVPITNGDFSAGLAGWETEITGHADGAAPGVVNALGGLAQLHENESFLVSLQQTFVIPPSPQTLTIDIAAINLESPNGGVPDAFEISLLDLNQQSLVPVHRPEATSFFNANPDNDVSLAPGVTFDGTTVTLDISALTPGTEATLYFDLIGNPPGTESSVSIDLVQVMPERIDSTTFTSVPLAGPFTDASSVAVGDVEGDGNVDIVVTDAAANQLVVFNGDGTGSFERSEIDLSPFGSGPVDVDTGLLTAGDSIDDLAIVMLDSDIVLAPITGGDDTPPAVTLIDPAEGSLVTDDLAQIRLQFSEDVQDTGPAGTHSVTNPAAYELVNVGPNGVFDNGLGDDVVVSVSTVEYDDSTFVATLMIAPAALPLLDGEYHLAVAGDDATLSIIDLAGNVLFDGNDASASFFVNTAPQITAADPVVANEGSAANLTVDFSDPGFLDAHAATIDWGDGATTAGTITETDGVGTIAASHTYADNGDYTVHVTLEDAAGNTAEIETTATISNVAPIVTSAGNQTAVEGEPVTLELASFSDPGFDDIPSGTEETFTATIDWGDGSAAAPGTLTVTPAARVSLPPVPCPALIPMWTMERTP